ncbi:histidine triad (HIT) family protein [Methanohalophilus levihalophilus]|uniref:HIT family protein n=1 Tax=Methanohalophilus levihalophilus TaxID=1431282 RepID=UPI001AEB475E|nr:HIT family protein [Methanohalophilus levihalophilus]MBP2030701.1 histidine triad (HIT) family protein [Methanohalophilus levihalophilus]
MDCLFCKIVSGEIPSYKIFEDYFTLAFLDINPVSRGHAVVIPKIHVSAFTEMKPDDAALLFSSVNKVTKTLLETLGAPAANIGLNNGELAGQVVPHVHVHIIPRYENDGGGSMHSIVSSEVDTGDLEDLAKQVLGNFQ